MRVIVTGGAGFIGANLCRALHDAPAVREVIALDDLSTGRRENLAGAETELVVGSILDAALLAKVFDGASRHPPGRPPLGAPVPGRPGGHP